MSSRKAKLMAHPLFIMSAPKAHYPLFNLVERAAYPGGRQPSDPSWSPSRKRSGSERRCKTRHPSPYAGRQGRRSVSAGRARGEEQAVSGGAWLPEEEEEEDEEEYDDNSDDDDAAVYALPSTVAELEEELSEISSMICEEKMDDHDDPLVVAGMADIDMNRLCFDDDIGRNSRFLGGAHAVGKVAAAAAAGAPAGASPSTRSALAKTAAEIMVALVKTEEEIRKLEQIAMVEGARLSRQGSVRRGWAGSPTGTAGGSGDDAGFCTPEDADELEWAVDEFEEVENGGGGTGGSLQVEGITTASLAQLIHQERMASAVAGGRGRHLRSSSISEAEGETTAAVLGRSDSLRRVRPPCYAFDDGDVMAAGGGGRRRFSGDFVSEREREKGVLRAAGKVQQQQQQQFQQQARRRPSPPHVTTTTTACSSGRASRRSSAGTSPCRPCFTPDDSRSPRLFSIEKLNAEFAAASSSCHARPVAAFKDRRRKLGAAADVRAAGTVNSRQQQQQQQQTAAAVCGGCRCGEDNRSSSRKAVGARLVHQQQQHGRKSGGGSGSNSHISVLSSSRSLREDTSSSSSSSSSSTGGSSRASFFSDRDRDRLQGMAAAGVYKGTGSGRRLSLPARPGGLHHLGTSSAAESPRTDGSSSRGSFKDSPFRPDSSPRRGPATWGSDKLLHPPSSAAAAGVGSDSPFRAGGGGGERDTSHSSSKAEPLQVKLAAPQSPLRFELSPSRFSAGSSSPRGGRFASGSASPLRARLHKSRVKLRLLSPFQLLRRLKEVCARLIIAASSSVKPVADPATVAAHFAAAPPGSSSSRPSTSSNCSFVSASAATPARNSSSSSSAPAPAPGASGGAATPARISHRRSYAGRLSRGSPNLCSPAVSRHSFYCEAISDCIEFIKRSSTADTTIL